MLITPLLYTWFNHPPMLSSLPTVYTWAVKQIATIQSALKPNTASTVPVSSVSPVGSVGTELPWLASASLLLETQPPWAYCYIIYLNCKRRTSNNEYTVTQWVLFNNWKILRDTAISNYIFLQLCKYNKVSFNSPFTSNARISII